MRSERASNESSRARLRLLACLALPCLASPWPASGHGPARPIMTPSTPFACQETTSRDLSAPLGSSLLLSSLSLATPSQCVRASVDRVSLGFPLTSRQSVLHRNVALEFMACPWNALSSRAGLRFGFEEGARLRSEQTRCVPELVVPAFEEARVWAVNVEFFFQRETLT